MNYRTDQEDFWAGNFGNKYIERNKGNKIIASNINFLCQALKRTADIKNCLEFGANIGNNLIALNYLLPEVNLNAIEINQKAIIELKKTVKEENIFKGSILDYKPREKYDLVLIKGVLIHLNPEFLKEIYSILVKSTSKYILLAEYYNPKPISIEYRGHKNKLFKRDFAGELMDNHKEISLLDYGFCYRLDPLFPADDYTWFLMQKNNNC